MPAEARHILNPAANQLSAAGIDSARSDARLLLGMAVGRDGPVLPHEVADHFTDDQLVGFAALIDRRLTGEPVSRMRGWREFWSLRFTISPATLDPRPDSEVLVEAACAFARELHHSNPQKLLRILDLGTGSGCLLLSCLSELPDAQGVGIDINPSAITIARQNAATLGMDARAHFIDTSFAAPVAASGSEHMLQIGGFDIILCNPPYIPSADIDDLAPDVADFDPRLALDGGDDGFACWRTVMPVIVNFLAPNGQAFVEIGDGQADGLDVIARSSALTCQRRVADLSGTIRMLVYRDTSDK